MRHAGVTEEQIAEAKRWDLLSYLQAYEPGELKSPAPGNTGPGAMTAW